MNPCSALHIPHTVSIPLPIGMNHQTMNACDNQQKLIACIMLLVVSITFIKLLLQYGSRGKRLPPTVSAVPLVGGLVRFMRGPIPMIREEYARLGSVFTVDILSRKITFLIGPEVSEHFFNGYESELSQQEVYRLTVPSFGRGVVYDVDYSVRLEQFRFFAESLHSNKLRGYVSQMVFETEVRITSCVLDLCSC